MSQVSRPMQIALLAVIAFAGVWFVALRPKPASDAATPPPASAATAPGVAGLANAVKKAHGAAATSDAANNRLGAQSNATGGTATPPGAPGRPASPPRPGTKAAPAPHVRTPAANGHRRAAHLYNGPDPVKRRLALVRRALATNKILVMAFYNPASFDDRAVRHELRYVHTRHGRVVKVAAPIAELSRYPILTRQVQIVATPTVVIVDRRHHAQTITGFADPREVDQRVADALTVRGG